MTAIRLSHCSACLSVHEARVRKQWDWDSSSLHAASMQQPLLLQHPIACGTQDCCPGALSQGKQCHVSFGQCAFRSLKHMPLGQSLTVVDPHAVMVHLEHTSLAHPAVVAARRLVHLTLAAEPELPALREQGTSYMLCTGGSTICPCCYAAVGLRTVPTHHFPDKSNHWLTCNSLTARHRRLQQPLKQDRPSSNCS